MGFESKTTQEWFDELRAADVPCDPIRFSEAVIFDEQAAANGYLRDYDHHTGHRYRGSGPVLHFTAGMPEPRTSPALGVPIQRTCYGRRACGAKPNPINDGNRSYLATHAPRTINVDLRCHFVG